MYDESYPKMYFLLNLSHYVKSCGHLSHILAFFTMPAHQIWSYHVTQQANFEKFLFCPNSTFNIRKSHKFLVESSLLQKLSAKNPTKGGVVENTTEDWKIDRKNGTEAWVKIN